eukprot:12566-Heterococcus_DN1.PRE.3
MKPLQSATISTYFYHGYTRKQDYLGICLYVLAATTLQLAAERYASCCCAAVWLYTAAATAGKRNI